MITQTYKTGEKIMLGDLVRWPSDEGKVIALESDLPSWGLSAEDSKGKVMIEFVKNGLVCEDAFSEDLQFIGRSDGTTEPGTGGNAI